MGNKIDSSSCSSDGNFDDNLAKLLVVWARHFAAMQNALTALLQVSRHFGPRALRTQDISVPSDCCRSVRKKSSVVNSCSQIFTLNTYCPLTSPTISLYTVQFIYIIHKCKKICIWILFLQIMANTSVSQTLRHWYRTVFTSVYHFSFLSNHFCYNRPYKGKV